MQKLGCSQNRTHLKSADSIVAIKESAEGEVLLRPKGIRRNSDGYG